jgi:gluconate 2-dehydrogenase gamma chain
MKFPEKLEQTLLAVIDRVIPPDDFPGASQSGVDQYLARQFETDLRPLFEDFCAGLTSVEAESVCQFQRGFSELTDQEKDSILQQVEAGNVSAQWTVSPQTFFRMLTNTTAEGFYSEPEQGGNHDAVSWVMIGFEKS